MRARKIIHVIFVILSTSQWISGVYIPPGPRFRCPERQVLFQPCSCVRGSDDGIYAKCENANLASLSLGLINLSHENLPIEELVLNKCNIGRMYGPALYPLKVRILRYVDTPLRLIDEHSFLGVNRTLQELHLVRTRLQKFPKEAFSILGNLTILNIDGHEMSELPKDSFAGSMAAGRIEKISITNGTLASLPVEALAPLRKVKSVDLHGNRIKELKRNQFRGLREVDWLDISGNLISKLDPSNLADLTKLNFCNLSRNAIPELKKATFSRNSLLQVVNLSHNMIKKLDANTFRGLRFMRRLYLSDNNIIDVGRGTFGSVTRIGTIDLARNSIKKIDFQMFNQLQYAEVLDVSENEVTLIEKQSFKDLYLARVNLSHNQISSIEAEAFVNCANITLDLSHNLLENISKYAFDSSTYALELQLSYNMFTELNQVPLHNMSGLQILNVSHNSMHSVPRQTFPKLYELHTIDLSYNNISEIQNGIFQTLFSLRYLNLSHNSLQKIKPSTFGSLPTLLDLDLSYNKLEDISRGSLAKLASCRTLTVKNNSLTKIFQLPISLGHLDFSENELEEIPTTEVWPSMNSLLSLDLSRNRLADNLQHGSFDTLLTLRTLFLVENNITKPPQAALGSLSSLQYLYMQGNHLTSLDKAAFGRLPIVFELNLSNNKIANVSIRAFEGLLQLLTLNLSDNAIRHIPNGAFQGLVSLRSLDLSKNRLEKLDNKTKGLLDDCLSLERINLSHNRISFITRKMFPNDPWIPYRLREIDLSYNTMPVITFDLTVGTRKVKRLNLSHNNINEIRKYVIGNLTSLEYLDLSYNDLSDISEPNVFQDPANLSEVYLNDNHLTSIPLDKIIPMEHLRVLDLRDNEFGSFNIELLKIIKNGTDLRYGGNPLHCDCYVRPLRRWLSTLTEIPESWTEPKCSSPYFLANESVVAVTEDLMVCDEREVQDNPDFEITPDLKYRSVNYNEEDNSWKVTWFVSSRDDIGDFYVVVREAGRTDENAIDKSAPIKPIFERDVVYIERSLTIRDLPDPSSRKLEMCILARDSIGNVKHFRKSQCRFLDKTNADFVTSAGSALSLFYPRFLIVVICIVFVRLP
ncbi:chaoptin [Neodiprion virginianus]|uniref:chaoptin n=1 Tax=Neodiprion virginianus TaxID=2961670 RepID=UPI001EE73977|nr:chaoptin [Neodiprion virginianus]